MEEDPVAQATFAQRLKQLMELRDVKQADVIRMAQTCGKHLGKSQVSQYVSGKTIPRRDVMDVLAAVFEVDAEWLATGKGPGPDAARATKPGSIPAPPARPIRSDSASHTTGGAHSQAQHRQPRTLWFPRPRRGRLRHASAAGGLRGLFRLARPVLGAQGDHAVFAAAQYPQREHEAYLYRQRRVRAHPAFHARADRQWRRGARSLARLPAVDCLCDACRR